MKRRRFVLSPDTGPQIGTSISIYRNGTGMHEVAIEGTVESLVRLGIKNRGFGALGFEIWS